MQTFEHLDQLLIQCTLPDPPCAHIAARIELQAAACRHPVVLNYLLRAAHFARAGNAANAAACLSLASAYYAE